LYAARPYAHLGFDWLDVLHMVACAFESSASVIAISCNSIVASWIVFLIAASFCDLRYPGYIGILSDCLVCEMSRSVHACYNAYVMIPYVWSP
jgi:hypothetical protein